MNTQPEHLAPTEVPKPITSIEDVVDSALPKGTRDQIRNYFAIVLAGMIAATPACGGNDIYDETPKVTVNSGDNETPDNNDKPDASDGLGTSVLAELEVLVNLTAKGDLQTDPKIITEYGNRGVQFATESVEDRITGETEHIDTQDGVVRAYELEPGNVNNCGEVIILFDATPDDGPIDRLVDTAQGNETSREIASTACVAIDKTSKKATHTLLFAGADNNLVLEGVLDADTAGTEVDRASYLVFTFNINSNECEVSRSRYGTEDITKTPTQDDCFKAFQNLGETVNRNFSY